MRPSFPAIISRGHFIFLKKQVFTFPKLEVKRRKHTITKYSFKEEIKKLETGFDPHKTSNQSQHSVALRHVTH